MKGGPGYALLPVIVRVKWTLKSSVIARLGSQVIISEIGKILISRWKYYIDYIKVTVM